jgi:transposase
MSRYSSYTKEFKTAMVEKLLSNSGISVKSLSVEAGIPFSTLRNWKEKYCKKKGLGLSKKKKNKLNSEEKFNIVILTASMSEAEKSEYCRTNGIYSEEIEQWKKDCIAGCRDKSEATAIKQNKISERKWKQEAKRLEKELNRKDKALAETAALLVLKKKVQAIWGDPEEDL